jgi:hypothetical protein
MSGDLVNGTQAQMAYYHTIRTSLAAFDQVRLNAVVAGLSICSALFIVALTAIKSVEIEQLKILGLNIHIHIKFIISAFFFLISAITSLNFCMKVNLYNYFIRTSVKILFLLEEKIVPGENLRFTNELNKGWSAGAKGDFLFLSSLILIACAVLVGFILSISLGLSMAS